MRFLGVGESWRSWGQVEEKAGKETDLRGRGCAPVSAGWGFLRCTL